MAPNLAKASIDLSRELITMGLRRRALADSRRTLLGPEFVKALPSELDPAVSAP